MGNLAVVVGNFIGAVLAQCAPVLVGIIEEVLKRAVTNTVEESNAPDDLRQRLLRRLRAYKDDIDSRGSAGPVPTPDRS